jgi:hypothetical protein
MLTSPKTPNLVDQKTREMPLVFASQFYSLLPVLHCKFCYEPLPILIKMYPAKTGWHVPNEPTLMECFIECKKCHHGWTLEKLGLHGKDAE